MLLIPPSLDFTDRDQTSLEVRMGSLLQSVFPDWTDRNRANFGNILLGLFAFVGDGLAFYQDNQAGEAFMATATQRKNLIAAAKMLNFTPKTAQAASATETFTLSAIAAGDVTIAAGQIVSTADVTAPIQFQLLEDLIIPAGQTIGTAEVEHSELQVDTFVSSGLPNQRFVLSNTPYLDDSCSPVAGDGTYLQVVNFLDSTSSDRHFVLVVDQNDQASITFGNGINGKIPVGTITTGSKTGGGVVGNVDASTINRISGSFRDSFGNPVRVSVTNAAKSDGGLDRQTVAQIKIAAPESIRASTVTVALEDFGINARKVTGVARALMATSNEDPAVPENSGNLYIVPPDGGLPSSALKALVKAQFIGPSAPFPSTLTFVVNVLDPAYKLINISATLWFRSGVATSVGAAAVRKTLARFFAVLVPLLKDDGTVDPNGGTPNPAIDFGLNLKNGDGSPANGLALSDIFDAIAETSQVLRVGGKPTDFLLNGVHGDVAILVREFPKLGAINLVDGLTGNLI